MADVPENDPFLAQLLNQDQPLSESDYKEYRMQLEQALTKAERRERLALRVAFVTGPLAFALMIVGGSGIVGGFDPWDKDANALSISLAAIYALCGGIFSLSIAAYYSRYRPRIKEVKEQLRDASILALHSEIAELRKQVELLIRGKDAG